MLRTAAQTLRRTAVASTSSCPACASLRPAAAAASASINSHLRRPVLPMQFRSASMSMQTERYQSTSRKKATPTHKPPKRRLEAASAPLRIHTPTRGPVLPCIAHTSAEKYDLINLGVVLRSLGVSWNEVPEQDKDRAFVIGPWKGRGGAERLISGKDIRRTTVYTPSEQSNSGDEMQEEHSDSGFDYGDRGEIWVFGNGSFVTWGLTEEEGKAFLREVIRRKGAKVEGERLPAKEYEIEEMDFVVDPDA